jgi:transcriptional regulator with XRE-family HTH domain
MSKISSNIRHLRQWKGLSQEQLAEALDITRARLGAYEEGRNEPPLDLLVNLSEYFHVAIDAMVRGDLKKTTLDGLMKVGKNRILFPILLDSEGNDMVELIPLKASAGYTRGYADPEYIEKLPKMKLPFLPTGKHRAFPIKGDSMPPIREGSFVIAKYIERPEDVKLGNTFIVVTKDDGLTYKRIMAFNKKEGAYELHSDNKLYPPFKVKTQDILEIWEYTCCLNMNQYREDELNLDSIMNMLRSLKVEITEIRNDRRPGLS